MPPEKLGETVEAFQALNVPAPENLDRGRIAGEVIYVDGFGNLSTNIRGGGPGAIRPGERCGADRRQRNRGISANYASAGTGNYLTLVNSWGLLEISRCNGSARTGLGAGTGTPVLLLYEGTA